MPPKKAAKSLAPAAESNSEETKTSAVSITFPEGTLPRTAEKSMMDRLDGGLVAGVDEAGRGPLAGPVVCAAVIIPMDVTIEGVNDSKKLDEQQRNHLFQQITSHPRIIHGVSVVDADVIDGLNILNATLYGMTEAAKKLKTQPKGVLVDGNKTPAGLLNLYKNVEPIIKGDGREFVVAAASIIAKVTRDRIMERYDEEFPNLGFKQHKGYPVPAHYTALRAHGFTRIHRKSFNPVKGMLSKEEAEDLEKLKDSYETLRMEQQVRKPAASAAASKSAGSKKKRAREEEESGESTNGASEESKAIVRDDAEEEAVETPKPVKRGRPAKAKAADAAVVAKEEVGKPASGRSSRAKRQDALKIAT